MTSWWCRAPWACAGIITGIYFWAGWRALGVASQAPAGFAVGQTEYGTATPVFKEEFIARDSGRMEHVASLCELSDRRLVAVWYSGSHEGSSDVALLLAVKPADEDAAWSNPYAVVTPNTVARELRRPVAKVGNAVVFTDAGDRLVLVFVSLPFGGWALSSLNAKVSSDGGTSWSPAQRLTATPLFNLGTLVKNKPLPLVRGGLLLPVSHEFLGRFPGMLLLATGDETVEIAGMRRLCGGRRFFQPALVALDRSTGVALLRAARTGEKIGLASSRDGGASWSEPKSTRLDNPDAGIDAVALSGRRVLLAFNNQRFGRSNLAIAVSADAGVSWATVATLEDESGAEFSYPFMLRGRDGAIHLVYTWKRRNIKHLTFNEAWIEAKLRRAL